MKFEIIIYHQIKLVYNTEFNVIDGGAAVLILHGIFSDGIKHTFY